MPFSRVETITQRLSQGDWIGNSQGEEPRWYTRCYRCDRGLSQIEDSGK